MRIHILYFAALRETLATDSETVQLPAEVSTLNALRNHLAARGGDWVALTTMKNLRAAINQSMVSPTAVLTDGDEVAFFPPVTGG